MLFRYFLMQCLKLLDTFRAEDLKKVVRNVRSIVAKALSPWAKMAFPIVLLHDGKIKLTEQNIRTDHWFASHVNTHRSAYMSGGG